MLSGDQILPIITSNVSVFPTEPDADPLRVWMESHDKFMSTPNDTLVLPAHNLPFYGVRERLRQLVDHHEDRMLAIEEHCVEPSVAKDLLPVLFKRELDPRQMMMALGEAIAHLHLLMHRNRIERSLAEDGRYYFTSIDPGLERRANPDRHEEPGDSPVMV
jgi:glyoxylase-like metal-dependent hydrolase (beta-lactamase superfamily II)